MSELQEFRTTITVVNSSINKKKTIQSNATSWEALKEELEAQDLSRGDVKAVIKENSCSLDLPTAEIPEGEITLFIVPKKSKAGDDYENLGFQELRTECSKRDSIEGVGGNYGKAVEMREKLRNDDLLNNKDKESTSSSINVTSLESIISRLEKVVDRIEVFSKKVDNFIEDEDFEEESEEDEISEEDEDFFNQINKL